MKADEKSIIASYSIRAKISGSNAVQQPSRNESEKIQKTVNLKRVRTQSCQNKNLSRYFLLLIVMFPGHVQ